MSGGDPVYDLHEAIVKAYKSGELVDDIAERLGTHSRKVIEVARLHGMSRALRPEEIQARDAEIMERLSELRGHGKTRAESIKQIAREMGMSVDNVRRRVQYDEDPSAPQVSRADLRLRDAALAADVGRIIRQGGRLGHACDKLADEYGMTPSGVNQAYRRAKGGKLPRGRPLSRPDEGPRDRQIQTRLSAPMVEVLEQAAKDADLRTRSEAVDYLARMYRVLRPHVRDLDGETPDERLESLRAWADS